MLHCQSYIVAIETVWAAKPKILTIWHFLKKVCQPLISVPINALNWYILSTNDCLLLLILFTEQTLNRLLYTSDYMWKIWKKICKSLEMKNHHSYLHSQRQPLTLRIFICGLSPSTDTLTYKLEILVNIFFVFDLIGLILLGDLLDMKVYSYIIEKIWLVLI